MTLIKATLILAVVPVVTIGVTAAYAAAQVPIELHAYGGVAVPRGDWNENDVFDNGWGYGANLVVHPIPIIGFYAGWDRFHFGFEEDGALAGTDVTINDTAIRGGVELKSPVSVHIVRPFVSGGFVFGQNEIELTEGDTTRRFTTDAKLGLEGSAGLDIAAGPIGIRPRVGYRSHAADFGDFSEAIGDGETTVSYLNFTVGISIRT
jgi:hypothetical protein